MAGRSDEEGGPGEFAGQPLGELVSRVAAVDPTPGAGPSLAWTCALAAALVEMVSGVALNQDGGADRAALQQRRARAAELRAVALALADADAEAYRAVLAVGRRRDEPGHPARLRRALQAAADPLIAIVQAAAEVTALAADAVSQVRGGARGEAKTAAVLGAAVVLAGVPLVELNLAGARDDPRIAESQELARRAASDRDRAVDVGSSSM